MSECQSERLKAYLQGWDDAEKCVYQTLSQIPDEHLVAVVKAQHERRTAPEAVVICGLDTECELDDGHDGRCVPSMRDA